VKVSILLDNALQHFSTCSKKNFYFLLVKLFNAGTGMRRGYPKPSGTGMGFSFLSPLDIGRVTGKYMRIGYGDGECKTRPHPAPLPCLPKLNFDSVYADVALVRCHVFFLFFNQKLVLWAKTATIANLKGRFCSFFRGSKSQLRES